MANFNEDDMPEMTVERVHRAPVIKGDFKLLPKKVKNFITHCVHLMAPRGIYISDGSKKEADEFIQKLTEKGTLTKLTAFKENYLCCTDPEDTARIESKTFIVTSNKYDAVPHVKEGVKGILGRWMSHEDAAREMSQRFPNCMTGRMMYVIPFSMGPLGSPFSKLGIQVTDSSYVLLSMRIMTRVSLKVFDVLRDGTFVKCIHSLGCPRPIQGRVKNHWPCNPEKVIIAHFPEQRMIQSFGSGYGGNSLLGKKCFALRIAGTIARDEGWLAEHMLIMSITTPQKEEYFIAAAFPSACGKTNLAMLNPTLPDYKIHCIGDDIAWMRFDKLGTLVAINPEHGFFGVAPGTNSKTNPIAMRCFEENSIFTNVGETSDGKYFWEGLQDETPRDVTIKTWLGKDWHRGKSTELAAHPNSRFTSPAKQCPIMHPKWDDPKGVPISAILFGGRRPKGVPLVFEARSWSHGVMIGACVKSECTAAAEFKGKSIMHDPMAMRPFLGYNFGHYLQHWLDLEEPGRQMPKIFHVNWFRLGEDGKLLWPGFGENIRVLDWIIRRCDNDDSIAVDSPVGLLPRPGSINMDGLPPIDESELLSLPKQYWLEDIKENRTFLEDQVGVDTPPIIFNLLEEQEKAFRANQQATAQKLLTCS
ncbi:hypothetical protein RRG08_051442 [Elysia crispata]|uniref:phosphoenolpyruvate carboxykinase (GTP) n=1 Tax=Elysia crispata TaxID=231223 RepID=A0AAE1EAS5_9GAST|nr:hypothetical protein RRG08_051442 [Elysia crispata]